MLKSIASFFGGLGDRLDSDALALDLQQASEVMSWTGSTGWQGTSGGDVDVVNYVWSKQLTQSGVAIDGTTALTISTFWACVKIISEDIGKLDINLCEDDKRGNKQIRNNHWLYKLLNVSPDGQITSQKFRETIAFHCLTWGNGYALTDNRNVMNGQLTVLDLIHPTRVRINVENGIRSYTVYANAQDKQKDTGGKPFPAERMFHLEGIGDKWSGNPVVSFARECLGITISLQDLQSAAFSNGCNLGGVLTTSETLEPSHRENMANEWTSKYGGASNSKKVAVLDKSLEYQQFSTKLTDSEVLESRKFQIAEVARFFNMPLHKLGVMDAATMNNMEQENKSYFANTLSPWIKRFEVQCNFRLLPANSRFYTKFDTKPLTMADIATQMAFWRDAIATGVATCNMAAADLDLETYDGGDVYYITANNLQPVEQAGINLEKSKEDLNQLKDAPAREEKAQALQAKALEAAPKEEKEAPEQTIIEPEITNSINNADNIDIFSYRALIEDKLKACITKEARFCEDKAKQMTKFGDDFNAEKFQQKEVKFYSTQKQYLRESLIIYFEQTGMPEPKGFIDKWVHWQEVENWEQLKANYIANDFIINYCKLSETDNGSVFEYELNGSIIDVKLNNGILECS